MKKQTVAIYIGRFQPLHLAHENNINQCLDLFDKTMVLIGSANQRASIKNPFDYQTRAKWVANISDKIIIRPLNDYLYNETKWITEVESKIYQEFDIETHEITLVGFHKDDSTYYLAEFPNFKYLELSTLDATISSTNIRQTLFSTGQLQHTNKEVAEEIIRMDIDSLVEEWGFYQQEKMLFASYPFPETLKFNCSDAVVVCDGNILLIERKIAPGKGCWALPGGFVNTTETYKQAAIRELYEETKLKVPYKVLNGSFKDSHIFDNPKRSLGIPRISSAFFFEIEPNFDKKLPKVKGSDDAASAKWFPLAVVKHMKLYDDHKDIIDYFTNSF